MQNPDYAAWQKASAKRKWNARKTWKDTASAEEVRAFLAHEASRRREWENTASGSEKVKAMKRRAYQRSIEFINSHKKECVKCGEKTQCCLQFHHKNKADKDRNVVALATRSRKRIIDEIAKCVVLCANCHCKIHDGIITL